MAAQYNSLVKVIGGISKKSSTHESVPEIIYNSSKFTRLLKNLLDVNCKLYFLGHITNEETLFEGNISLLEFIEKCRKTYLESALIPIESSPIVHDQDKLLIKLNQENIELKGQIKHSKDSQKQKLTFLKNALGFDFDLENILKGKINSRETDIINMYKDVYNDCEYVNDKNALLQIQIKEYENNLSIITKESKELQEKFSRDTIIYRESILKEKSVQEELKKNLDYKLKQIENQKQKSVNDILNGTNKIIEEKLSIVENLRKMIDYKPNSIEKAKIPGFKELSKQAMI